MGQVIWAPSALDDADEIAKFIARDSKSRAGLLISRIFKVTESLAQFPLSGRMIPEMGDQSCREIMYGSYRIMYRVENDDIWVVGIVHGARDWDPKEFG